MTELGPWLLALGERGPSPELSFEVPYLRADHRDWLAAVHAARGPVPDAELVVLARQRVLEVHTEAIAVLTKDMERSVGFALPEVSATPIGENLILTLENGAWYTSDHELVALGRQSALLDVAAMFSHNVVEREGVFWPSCSQHDRPLIPELRESEPSWMCSSRTPHPVCAIGALTASDVMPIAASPRS